jgi:bacillithiol synthase
VTTTPFCAARESSGRAAVSPNAGTPMSRAPIRGVKPLIDAMVSVAGSAGESGLDALRRCYRDGQTIGDAYVAFMRSILGPLGIAVFDPSHPAALSASRPTMVKALSNSVEIERQLGAWNDSLEDKGFKLQVESVPGLSLVFANEDGIKRRIPVAEANRPVASTDVLSPNVLLRPIVEASILPTVAYVAGPGEIAYFAQIPPIASALGVERPVAVPRWSTTIVEPGIDRILERYGVSIDQLKDFDRLLTEQVKARTPEDVRQPLGDLALRIDEAAASLLAVAKRRGIEAKIIEGMRDQLALRLVRGERRITAALKRNEQELRRDLGTARASLFPDGIRQERSLSFVPFIARYDRPLLEEMLAAAGAHAERLLGVARPVAIG